MKIPFITPSDRILTAVKKTLLDFDWIAAGFDPAPRIRHARRRFATPDEVPCISIRWEQDEPRNSDGDTGYITPDEMFIEMTLVLEIDFDADDDEDADPTGLGAASAIAFAAMRALKDPEGDLCRLWANGVTDRGRGEDPDSTNDAARLDQSVIVLYRVLTADPSVLLSEGMNA